MAIPLTATASYVVEFGYLKVTGVDLVDPGKLLAIEIRHQFNDP